MTKTIDALAAISARLKAGETGQKIEIDLAHLIGWSYDRIDDVWHGKHPGDGPSLPAWSRSLDHATRLLNQMLPGWTLTSSTDGWVDLHPPRFKSHGGQTTKGDAPTESAGRLNAVVQGLIRKAAADSNVDTPSSAPPAPAGLRAYLLRETDNEYSTSYYLVPQEIGKALKDASNAEASWDIREEGESYETLGFGERFGTAISAAKFALARNVTVIEEIEQAFF